MADRFKNLHRKIYDNLSQDELDNEYTDALNKYITMPVLEKIGFTDVVKDIDENITNKYKSYKWYNEEDEDDINSLNNEISNQVDKSILMPSNRATLRLRDILYDKEGYKKNVNYDYQPALEPFLTALNKEMVEYGDDTTVVENDERVNVPVKKLYDDTYKSVGGLKGLFEKRRAAGLKVDYDQEEINKVLETLGTFGKGESVPFINTFELLKDKEDMSTGYYASTYPNVLDAVGVYQSANNAIKASPTASPTQQNQIFMHELRHKLQDVPYKSNHQIIPRDFMQQSNDGKYELDSVEVEATIAEQMSKWQAEKDRVIITPKDVEDFIKDTDSKNGFEYNGRPIPPFMLRIMIPKLAYNESKTGGGYA